VTGYDRFFKSIFEGRLAERMIQTSYLEDRDGPCVVKMKK